MPPIDPANPARPAPVGAGPSDRADAAPRGERRLILDALGQADHAEQRARASSSAGFRAGFGAADRAEPGVFPGYDLLREIHRGGQGVVYLALQRSTKRRVAVKVLHGGATAGPERRARFEREVQVLGQLNHPGIVKIHDSGCTPDGSFFYVMDYIAGRSLDDYIRGLRAGRIASRAPASKRRGPGRWRSRGRFSASAGSSAAHAHHTPAWAPTVDAAAGHTGHAPQAPTFSSGGDIEPPSSLRDRLELFANICDAVFASHLHGVIHRDIKPANIRLDARGTPVLVDFGLAKIETGSSAPPAYASDDTGLLEGGAADAGPGRAGATNARPADAPAADPAPQSITGQFIGSLPWASPEQAEGLHARVDARTDVYSLGVVLYQLTTAGRFPYRVVGRAREVLDNIVHADPARPSSFGDELDERVGDELETIILKALAKEPQRRYQSAGELGRDVRRYLAGEAIEAKRDSGWYMLSKSVRRHRTPVALGAAACLGVAAFAVTAGTLWARAEHALGGERLARAQADAERARAEANFDAVRGLARTLMFDVHDQIENLRGATRARETLLSEAQRYLQVLDEQLDGADAVRPELLEELAEAHDRLGDIQSALAEPPPEPTPEPADAAPATATSATPSDRAEASYRRAYELRTLLVTLSPQLPGPRLGLATSSENWASALRRRRLFTEALSQLDQAERHLADAAERGADAAELAPRRASLAAERADLHRLRGENAAELSEARAHLAQAERSAADAAASRAAAPGPDAARLDAQALQDDARIALTLGRACAQHADTLTEAGRPDEAAPFAAEAAGLFERAAALAERSAADLAPRAEASPADGELARDLMLARHEAGLARASAAREAPGLPREAREALREAALAQYRAALRLAEQRAADLSDLEAQRDLGTMLNKVGNELRALERLDDAAAVYDALLTLRESVSRADPIARHARDLFVAVFKRAQIDELLAARETTDAAARDRLLLAARAGYERALGVAQAAQADGAELGSEAASAERRLREVRALLGEGNP